MKKFNEKIIIFNDEEIIKKLKIENLNKYAEFNSVNCNHDIPYFIKKNWNKTSKIVSINNNEIEIAIKYEKSWKHFSSVDVEVLYSRYKKDYNLKFVSESKNEKNFKVEIDKGKIIYNDEHSENDLINKIDWVLSDEFLNDVKRIYDQHGFFHYITKEIEVNEIELFNKFKDKLLKNENIDGLEYSNCIENSNHLEIKTKNGKFILNSENENKIIIESILCSKSELFELLNFEKGMLLNIERNINNFTLPNVRIGSQILKMIIGISLFITFLALTFSFIFDPINIEYFFGTFKNKSTWTSPWMYLIISCFLTSYVITITMGMLLDKHTLKRERIEFKRAMHYFVAGSISGAATFFTGNIFIAMFAWTWYLNRSLKIQTVSLIKVYSTSSIIRLFVIAFFGLIFMLNGTIDFYLMYDPEISPLTTGVIVSSWIGFVWQLIHSSAIYFLLVSPFIARFFLNLIYRFKNIFNDYTSESINNLFLNKEQYVKGKLNLNWSETKKIFYIFIAWTLSMIMLEGVDTLFHFNYIEQTLCIENGLEFKMYGNPISIISLRYMSLQIHHIPIVNILPGKGLFFSELGLKVLYEPVFTKHHGIDFFPNYNSEDLAEMVSFSTRFFGMYLKNIVSFIIATFAITFTLISRKAHSNI